MKWPHYPKDVNQINLNFIQIFVEFNWMWIFTWIKLSWSLALCRRNLNDSIGSGNFSVRSSSFNWKGFWYLHGLAVYVKEGLPIALISRKLCRFLFMFLAGFTLFSVLLLFPLLITFFIFMHSFWCYFF